MNWNPVERHPDEPGEYLTCTISRRTIDAKSHIVAIRYMGRERVYWDGVAWAHNGFTHWRKELQ
jgi:hypothetical protein